MAIVFFVIILMIMDLLGLDDGAYYRPSDPNRWAKPIQLEDDDD